MGFLGSGLGVGVTGWVGAGFLFVKTLMARDCELLRAGANVIHCAAILYVNRFSIYFIKPPL